ncbi:MAG: methyltransferase domain-containing protein [Candidatus Hydrogenedens sp.]|nr:methyltransferase domain-containing protein [Candidatus Hydrogenedens sp.]
MALGIAMAERGLLPDSMISLGIQLQLRERMAIGEEELKNGAQQRFIESLDSSPIAVETAAANDQHYELPAPFFQHVLGPRLKYSSCLYERGDEDLATAEYAMLRLTAQRAELEDGQRILELGCGWGSLTLWMAEQYPNAQITAVSNSHSQREFIESRCELMGLNNVTVHTCDINRFRPEEQFDRVVSVEMFEHVRNHRELFNRIESWLAPGGKLFVHIFCHRRFCYPYVAEDEANWMARYFFTGGIMPSFDRLPELGVLELGGRWEVNGMHYGKTLRHWLATHDAKRDTLMPILAETYGSGDASRWFHRWRLFYLACAELFEYKGGTEWFVAHYLFENPSA